LEGCSFFDLAWEDRYGTESSALSSSLSAISGHDETVSPAPTPEEIWDSSLYPPFEFTALEPGLDLTVDVNPVNDYESGISKYPPLSSFGEQNLASSSTRPNTIPISLECNDSTSFDRYGLDQQTQSPSSEPRLISPPQGLTASHPPPVFSSSEGQSLSISHGPPRVPLSRLSRLKCPRCQQNFVDKCQLR
jgi:hypothetical protein